jgi:NAD+ synthase
MKPALQTAGHAAVEALARETVDGGTAALVGSPWLDRGRLCNGAWWRPEHE